MAPQIQTVKISDFSGGLNKDKDAALLKPNESPYALNCEFTRNGAVKSRPGLSLWSTNHNANMAILDHIFSWQQIGTANDWIIVVDTDGDVFYSNTNDFSGAAVADYASSSPMRREHRAGAILNDVFYLSSLDTTINPQKFDGTTWSAISDVNLDGTGAEFARARFLLSKHERIFAFSVNNNGTEHFSRIWWSNAGDAETWQSTSWIDVDPDDGSEINGVASFGDGILILKDRSVFILSGTDENSFTLYPVETSVGTLCPKTVVSGANKVFWLDPFQGVYVFDGANVTPISDPIRNYLLDNINNAEPYVVRHSAFFHRDKYYLSVCWDGGTRPSRTFIYDTQLESWSEWDVGFSDAVVRDGEIFVTLPFSPRYSGQIGIFKIDDSVFDDFGNAFTSTFRTSWFSPSESVSMRHRLRHLTAFFSADATSGAHDIKVYKDYDQANVVASDTFDTTQTGTEDEKVADIKGVGGTFGRAFQVEVSENAAEPWQLNGLELTFNVRPYRRGDRSL